MSMPLQILLTEAQQLPPHERNELIVSLLSQNETDLNETPESIVTAWHEEIAHRIDALARLRAASFGAF